MKIVCASSLAMGREAFSTLGDVDIVPEQAITPHVVRDADALITRSKVKVDRALLDGSSVAFVGTATAGTDHIDIDYLNSQGIAWTSAPGCNANSVAEYVVAALLCMARRHHFTLQGKSIAIVGVGHIGRRVVEKANILGLRVLQNDPPLFAETQRHVFRPLDEILPAADIVTLHVPLSDTGPYATRRLVNNSFFGMMKPGAIFINAARGEVTDSNALLSALGTKLVAHAVLDVFENEPAGPRALLQKADIISPHIAGYSFQGKVNGTYMVYREACNFFEIEPAWKPPNVEGLPPIEVSTMGRSDEEVLGEVMRGVYDIEADDAALRAGVDLDDAARGKHFEKLRAGYPVRHECSQRTVSLEGVGKTLRQKIAALGFQSLEK